MKVSVDFDLDHIIQIMPADGWCALFEDEGKIFRTPLVGWGLTKGGNVIALTSDSSGADAASNSENFRGVWKAESWIKHDLKKGS